MISHYLFCLFRPSCPLCGLEGKLKETNLEKYSAYYGLFMSAINKVTTND